MPPLNPSPQGSEEPEEERTEKALWVCMMAFSLAVFACPNSYKQATTAFSVQTPPLH